MSETNTVSPLRQRVIEDVAPRKLTPTRNAVTSKAASGLPPCLGARPIRASICNRNRIMTGLRFLFRVTLRRHDLAAEVWHIKESLKLPPVLSPEEVSVS
ncbi:hypothetical protein [Bradyrhizobium sp. SEMIA]|uniref:hypothetical protein n=1 Tax=Bradyrhizobium sp. SEMIA TaxID=2597515 RepID=UPI0022409377|nr:hypothetical protein [Bradyrhizobium sp. SEMIA]